MAIGIAVSAVLHVLLLLAWRERFPHPDQSAEPRRMTLEVFLPPLPTAPPRSPVAQREPEKPPRTTEVHRQKRHTIRQGDVATATPPVLAQPPSAPPPANVHPGSQPPSRYIDPDAALASVPGIMKELDREKKERPVDQVAAKPLYGPDEETRLGQKIANAGRPDCMKTILPGGLLAPLFMLAEKKGTGCKW